MTGQNDHRVMALEEEVAHLAKSNEELSSELATQWKRIDALETKLKRLEAKLQGLADNAEAAVENTRPPHY